MLLRLLAFLLFVSLGAAAEPHPSLPKPTIPDGLGVNIHFTDPKAGEMEMIAAAGFRWVRMDFGWASTERTRGHYDFSAYDRLMSKLDEHHMHAVFILDYGNKLYEPERSVRTAEGRAAFAKWAATAAAHFRDRGVLWEIWNEPNGGFWSPKADVDEYAALAVETCKAMRAAAPGEAIIGPATSTIDFKFLEACFKAGLLDWWDAVSVHPYRQQGPENAAAEYHKLRGLIARYAPKDRVIPILSGEWGYSSAWHNFTPEEQGWMLPRQWMTNLANGVPLSIWYDWHEDGTDPKEPEHHFGSVGNAYHKDREPVYDPKPAYLAARTMTSVLNGYRFLKSLATDRAEDHAVLFENGEKLGVAAWTEDREGGTVSLPSSAAPAKITGHLGDEVSATPVHEGSCNLKVTGAPQYAFFAPGNPLLANAPAAQPLKITVAPAMGKKLPVRIENLSNAAYSGMIALEISGELELSAANSRISFAKDEGEKEVVFNLKAPPHGEYGVAVKITSDNGAIARASRTRFKIVDDASFAKGKLVADGDAKINSTQSVTTERAPEALADATATVLKLSYRFEEGWKFLRLIPADKQGAAIEGTPTAFGLWIYGDESGAGPRVRVADATGQVWQPSADVISWKGWRFVKFDFHPTGSHWGGKNDGIIHAPLHWDSFLVFDNVSRHPLQGAVYVASPVLIY